MLLVETYASSAPVEISLGIPFLKGQLKIKRPCGPAAPTPDVYQKECAAVCRETPPILVVPLFTVAKMQTSPGVCEQRKPGPYAQGYSIPLNTYAYILCRKVSRIGEPAQTSTTSSLVESRFLFVWKHSHCVALADPELNQFVDQLWD